MRNTLGKSKPRRTRCAILGLVVLATVAITTLLAAAQPRASLSITINNNSQWQVRGLYLAVGNPDNWGPDQLNGSTISPGASITLNNVACDGASLRVIAEDQNGCFFYHTVSCEANATWTITANDRPDCGS